MKARMSSLRRMAALWLFIAIIIVTGFSSATIVFSEARFRSFSDDRGRVEGLLDRAGEENTLGEWENAARTGRDALRGEWEREADRVIEEELREQGDTPELHTELAVARDSARAAWEGALEDEITQERGTWYAQLQDMAVPQIDRQALARALRDATSSTDSLTGNERIAAWDALVDPEAAGLTALWEERLGTLLASARQAGNVLDEESRAAYDREIDAIERTLRREFTLEKNSLLYRERNSVVWDSLYDSSSLRYESEQDRADRVTEQIISDTNEELQRVESGILRRDTSTREGAGAIDISNLGDNWQDRIKELLEQGNEKWRLAQEELYREMRLWKTTAEEAYDEGEKEWQDAYNRLEAAHKKWQGDIQKEIDEGINAWTAQQQELSQNLLDSQQYSNQYLTMQMDQWNSHSAELYRILTEGQQAIVEAQENLAWFGEMYELYENVGFYDSGISDIYLYFGEDIRTIDVMNTILGYTVNNPRAYELLQILYYQPGLFGYNPTFWNSEPTILFNRIVYDTIVANKFEEYRRFYLEGFEIVPVITPEYDETTGVLTEHYQIKVGCDYIGIDRRRDNMDLWVPFLTYDVNVSYTNVIGPDTDVARKSRLYYYVTEKSGWNSIVNNINSTITNSETYLHNELLLGENGGPGYLTNSDGTYGLKYLANGDLDNDPYLMTQSEMQYEYARRDMEFRKERLGIAEAVLQYARPEMYDDTNPYAIGGIREDAGITEERVAATKSEMERLKQEYDTAKSGIDVTLGTINTKKAALDALSGGVANAQKAMEDALPAYSAARLKVVEAENNGGADNTLLEELQASGKAYHEAEAAYKALNEQIENARKEYNDAVSSYTAHMNDVSEKYSAYHTAEQQYETAYAVWEYANTPYLMESSEFETGIGTGQLVDGTGIDFNDLDAPDALERYQRCLEEFTATEQTLQAAKAAMDSQETAEDLGDDSAYTAFKDAVNAATGAISGYLLEDTVDEVTLQTLMAERGEALNAYRNYCAEAAANGTHEGTVLLRDEEAMLWQQLMDAKEKGLSTVYNLVTSDIVYDGAGNSVTDRIVQNLAAQNSAFQDQLRTQQADTFTERKSQWVDTISFIQNRGEREWTNSMNEFTNLWKKWRLSARDAITEGEKEWTAAAKELNTKVNAWNADAAEAVSAAGSEQIYNSLKEKLTGQLAGMYARIGINRDNMPDLKTGVEQTLARALASMPEGIGILKDSAFTVDTTAGFSEMLDLGLSGALFERYEREMSRFSDRMSVMQSVKMGEVAYQSYMAILKQFSDDLRGMNKSTSDSVKTNIRDAAPYSDAPFEQSKGCWKIRYIRSYSLATGRKYGSLVINDYSYYVNTTVFLKKLKGIEGDIDFSNPYTYENIDPEELNLYISMEQEHLTKEINNVFCAGGRFEKHSGSEMQRLSQKFSEGYEKYVKGQAMVAGGWYSAPLAPGVPVNTVTVAKVAGSIALSSAGCPWLAFALNSSLTALEAKDGGLTWKQAAVQVGINAAITGLSAGAGDLMGSALGGTKSMGQQIAIAAARSAVSTTGNTLASCIDYESGGGFGFSKDRFTDDKTWTQAGLSFATSFAASSASIGMKQGLGIKSNLLATTTSTSINTVSSNFTVGGDGSWNWGGWGNIDTQKAVISGVGSYVSSTATGKMANPYMKAFTSGLINSYTSAFTANMFERFGGRDFGGQYSLDKTINVDTMSIAVEQAYAGITQPVERRSAQSTGEDNRSIWEKIGDDFSSIGKSFSDEFGNVVSDAGKIGSEVIDGLSYVGGKLKDFGKWAVDGVVDLAQSTGNAFSVGWFATDATIKTQTGMTIDEYKKWVKYIDESESNGIEIAHRDKIEVRDEEAIAKQENMLKIKNNRKRMDEYNSIISSPAEKAANLLGLSINEKLKWERKLGIQIKNHHSLERPDETQNELIGYRSYKSACVFSSDVGIFSKIIGEDINQREFYEKAKAKGIVTNGFFVKNQNSLAKLAGLSERFHSLDNSNQTTLLKSIITQLNNNNYVAVNMQQHTEIVYGYEFSQDGFRLLAHDVGFQNDKYVDAATMRPYSYSMFGNKIESNEYKNGEKVKDWRNIYSGYYFK